VTTRASQPRFRIYTKPSSYGSILRDLLLGRADTGDDCEKLEAEIAAAHGQSYAICTPQARVGIFLAIAALVRPGRKVVLSPYTLSDVINMVICAGAIPVFADIQRETCNIDPQQIENSLDDSTDAVMVTHLHGLISDMPSIKAICQRNRVKLLEDAAQAFGAHLSGRYAGTFGDAGIYSFGMYKNVNAFYGGMVVTPHHDAYEAIKIRVNEFPWDSKIRLLQKALLGAASDAATFPPLFKALTFWAFRWAYLNDIEFLNRQVKIDLSPAIKHEIPMSYLHRMTPMQARLVRSQLPLVAHLSEKRIEAARLYYYGLKDIPNVILPPLREDGSHIYTHYPIQVENRREFLRHMVRAGRDMAIQHLRNCADLPCFSEYHHPCPNAAATAASNVLMPTYPRYAMAEVEANVKKIRAYYGVP